jgi:N-hydroxyarylamine O-acetyltransferase
MTAQLDAYLARIGYVGQPKPDFATLKALHRAHLLAISYENLDIHCGRYVTVDDAVIFDKIVTRRRGGWCYEMNGLLAWALRAIGFEVRLMGSTVNRQPTGKTIEGNHLILLVTLDRPYLVDVGFGNGIQEPIPLAPGAYTQGYLTYHLREEDGRWWFQNHIYGGAGFDFTLDAHQLGDFAPQSHELQTWEDSGFVRTTVCHRFTPEGFITLKGAVLWTITAAGRTETIIENLDDYRRALSDLFDLHLSPEDTERLWEGVWARHLAWVNEGA